MEQTLRYVRTAILLLLAILALLAQRTTTSASHVEMESLGEVKFVIIWLTGQFAKVVLALLQVGFALLDRLMTISVLSVETEWRMGLRSVTIL